MSTTTSRPSVARGVLTVTGSRVIGLIFSLVQIKLAVTYLGPTRYGHLMTVVVFMQALTAWTDLGVGTVVVRRVSARGADLTRTVGLAIALALLVSLPLVATAAVGGWALYRDNASIMLGIAITSLGVIATTWSVSLLPVAQITGRFGHYAAAELAGRSLSLVLAVLAVRADLGLGPFFAAQILVPVFQLVALRRLAGLIGRFSPVWAWREMGGLLRESLPLSYICLVSVLYYTVDGLLLTKLSSPEQVGAYGLSYRIVTNFTIVSTSASAVLAARFAASAARDTDALSRQIADSLRGLLMVAAPLALLVGPLAPEILHVVASPQMIPLTATPLTLVAAAVGIGMVTAICSTVLVSDYQQRTITILNTVTLLVNNGLNLWWIPRAGATGAGYALVASEGLGLAVCLLLMLRRYPACVPWPSVGRLALALGAGYAVAVLLPPAGDLPRLLAVACAYAVVLLASGYLRRDELRRLLRLR